VTNAIPGVETQPDRMRIAIQLAFIEWRGPRQARPALFSALARSNSRGVRKIGCYQKLLGALPPAGLSHDVGFAGARVNRRLFAIAPPLTGAAGRCELRFQPNQDRREGGGSERRVSAPIGISRLIQRLFRRD
jgi:hypothetical protein